MLCQCLAAVFLLSAIISTPQLVSTLCLLPRQPSEKEKEEEKTPTLSERGGHFALQIDLRATSVNSQRRRTAHQKGNRIPFPTVPSTTLHHFRFGAHIVLNLNHYHLHKAKNAKINRQPIDADAQSRRNSASTLPRLSNALRRSLNPKVATVLAPQQPEVGVPLSLSLPLSESVFRS